MRLQIFVLFFVFTVGSSFNFPLVSVHQENFKKIVEQSDVPVFLTLTASWCQNCKKLITQMESLSQEVQDRCLFATIDVDVDNAFLQELLQQIFQKHLEIIGGFPALLIFNKESYKGHFLGFFQTEEDLLKKVDEVLINIVH